ncbi:MAG: PDDEXK nuclease domain-containing protein [Endomicrobia bacterium]|nr:PDDEXK nuclease domain-containing protein [Endomicrobiia bacterium]
MNKIKPSKIANNKLTVRHSLDFNKWLRALKQRIRQSQIKAAVKVNSELLKLYWDLGNDIATKKMDSVWGSGFYEKVSKELKSEFPDMQGFSSTNLKYCKYFYQFYGKDAEIRPQLVDELENSVIFQIPWGHHREIINKCSSVEEALFYISKTIENGWSRAVLLNFLEAGLYKQKGKSVTNFDKLLPAPQSDLAKETLKDPYNFDFLTLSENYKERELENELSANITKFLLELGRGFAFVGRQISVMAGKKELFIDMLFYHLKLRCFIVVELKAGEFDASFTGQLGAYVSAVNHQLKNKDDNTTLGLLICKTKDNVLAQYALEGSSHPIGISEYKLTNLLPKNLKSELPSIAEIESRIKRME